MLKLNIINHKNNLIKMIEMDKCQEYQELWEIIKI